MILYKNIIKSFFFLRIELIINKNNKIIVMFTVDSVMLYNNKGVDVEDLTLLDIGNKINFVTII